MRGAALVPLAAALALLAAGCSVTAPIDGVFADGDKFTGTAVGYATGQGTISVASESGLACEGAYDPFDLSRVLRLAVVCNDGQVGMVTVLRDPGLQSGSGTFELGEGRTGRFTFRTEG